jgi:hypothetical protein
MFLSCAGVVVRWNGVDNGLGMRDVVETLPEIRDSFLVSSDKVGQANEVM